MNGKKAAIIQGMLMSPLTVGHRALIYAQGHPMLTSTVVAIHDISDEHIRFETRNTNYTLLLHPDPETACAPLPAALAA